jgi:molybdopterin molybdotransferase
LIPVAEAQARILAEMPVMHAEQVSLVNAHGRVLAQPVSARTTQPPVALSAMDGYAVRSEDVASIPARLKVVVSIPAGSMSDRTIKSGEAARIFTGAPLPAGADAIVIQEDTDCGGETVTINAAVPQGHYVRSAGLDFSEGDVLIEKGTRLGARAIGLAAAMNLPWLPVTRKPRIALLATGDEIVLPGEQTGATRIVSSNNFALAALIEMHGGVPVDLGISPDNEVALATKASAATGCDMLVTTGGASVGEHDLIQPVLGKMGLDVGFWKIAMRPGKPLIFGSFSPAAEKMGFLGFPGNPVSSLVCGLLFLLPAIAKMSGRLESELLAVPQSAILDGDLGPNDARETYLRARLKRDGNKTIATPFPVQDSSMLRTLHDAQCLIIRPPNCPAAASGDPVSIVDISHH